MLGEPDSGIREIFACGIRNPPKKICLWNPKSWALESGLQFKKFGIPLTIGFSIQVPQTKTRIQYLRCVIHRVESTIQDSLGLPYSVPVYRQTRRASIVIKNLWNDFGQHWIVYYLLYDLLFQENTQGHVVFHREWDSPQLSHYARNEMLFKAPNKWSCASRRRPAIFSS